MSDVDLMPEVDGLLDAMYEEGWNVDGLPCVPPTRRRVEQMLTTNEADPEQLIAVLPPRGGLATMRTVAANCVMAGCRDDYFPVVVSAVRALGAPAFGLAQVQATTHLCAPLAIVNGPIRRRIGMNCGAGLFGPGNRANATIGRAIRLVLMNVGGGVPVSGDRSTLGHPGKYTFCVAEAEEDSPWEPFSVSRGLAAGDDAVTMFAAEAPRSVSDHPSETGAGVLQTFAESIADKGHNNAYLMGQIALVVGLEHARTLARDGWTRQDVQEYLFQQARLPIGRLRHGGLWGIQVWPRWVDQDDDHALAPMVARPEDFLVLVAGGEAGRFSGLLPGWGLNSVSVTTPIGVSGAVACAVEGGGAC